MKIQVERENGNSFIWDNVEVHKDRNTNCVSVYKQGTDRLVAQFNWDNVICWYDYDFLMKGD